MLYIDIDEVDIEKKKSSSMILANLIEKHIIQCYNEEISNIPEEPRYISYNWIHQWSS